MIHHRPALRRPPRYAALAWMLAVSVSVSASFSPASGAERDGYPHRGGLRSQAELPRLQRQAERLERRQPRGVRLSRPQPSVSVQAMPVVEAPIAAPLPPPEPVAPTERPGRPGRLSPDERRALRQQINDAGRDVYRPFGQ